MGERRVEQTRATTGQGGDAVPRSAVAEFAAGTLRSGAVLLGFVVFGLGWAAWLEPASASSPAPAYAPAVSTSLSAASHPLWLVDGYNVVCAALLGGADRSGWWHAEHREALLERLARFDAAEAELWVVFDGSDDSSGVDSPHFESALRTVFAPCADSWVLEQVRLNVARRPVCVATADRKLADRARHRGAEVVSPRRLLERCVG